MIKEIIKGYKQTLLFMLRLVVLLLVCLGCGFGIVWPLWKLATVFPIFYTAAIGLIFTGGLLYLIIKKCRKIPARTVISCILQTAVIAAGTAGCVLCVLHGNRVLTIPVLAAAFILFGLCRFGFRDSK